MGSFFCGSPYILFSSSIPFILLAIGGSSTPTEATKLWIALLKQKKERKKIRPQTPGMNHVSKRRADRPGMQQMSQEEEKGELASTKSNKKRAKKEILQPVQSVPVCIIAWQVCLCFWTGSVFSFCVCPPFYRTGPFPPSTPTPAMDWTDPQGTRTHHWPLPHLTFAILLVS